MRISGTEPSSVILSETRKILMLSKPYESTEVDCKTWLHVPSGPHWSTSSDTHQVVEIQIETSTKMYSPF